MEEKITLLTKLCEGCGRDFRTPYVLTCCCSNKCEKVAIRKEEQQKRLQSLLKSRPPKDKPHTKGCPKRYYVYAWLDANKVFYIGKGVYSRAFGQHSEQAEKYRKECQSFRVVVIKDDLSSVEAYKIENVLIKLIRPECNVIAKTAKTDPIPFSLSPYLLS